MARRTHTAYPVKTMQTAMDNSINMVKSAVQFQEMLWASSMTIGLRLSAMGRDLSQNQPQDMVEATRMVSEKNAAWLQSGGAMSRWQNALFKNYWGRPAQVNLAAPFAMFDPAVVSKMLAGSTQWTALTLKGISQTMSPYHSKSTANARRLSGKTRKTRKKVS